MENIKTVSSIIFLYVGINLIIIIIIKCKKISVVFCTFTHLESRNAK